MNEIQESKPIIEMLVGAVMTLALSFFKLTQRGHERRINALQRELNELKQTAATKSELESMYRETTNHLVAIRETVTRSHERIDELLLLEREKSR
jgi:hypothetical protein